MTSARVLEFQLGQTTVNFCTDQDELSQAVGHIYQSFLVAHETLGLPDVNSFSNEGRWQAAVDGCEFNVPRFDLAVRTLEEFIADQLLVSFADCLLLHAAAVCDDDTNVFVAGKSGSGKTTIALELVRRGNLFLTDEFSAIESCGTVIRPFPRSATRKYDSPVPAGINLEIPEGSNFRSHMLPDHRSELGHRAIKSSLILFPSHQPDVRPAARLLDSAETCALLMPSIFDFEGNETDAWQIMANLVTTSRACAFNFRDAATDLELVFDLLD